MGAGRRTATHTGSHPPTLSPESALRFGSRFRLLPPQKLAAVIFGCTHATIAECLEKKLFGLQRHHITYVQNVQPGMPLFLFNYTDKKLHAIFEAASCGQMDINPNAWSNSGTYPAQVLVQRKEVYPPLPESCFKQAISSNYYTDTRFVNELDESQATKLMILFKKGAVEVKPQMILFCDSANQEEEAESDGWIKRKETVKPGKKAWQNAPHLMPAVRQSSASELVLTEARHKHGEELNDEDIYSGNDHTDSVADVTHKWEKDQSASWRWEDNSKREISSWESTRSFTESASDLIPCQFVPFYADRENKEPGTEDWEHKGNRKQKVQQPEKVDMLCNETSSEMAVLLERHVKNEKKIHKLTCYQAEDLHNRMTKDEECLAKEKETAPAQMSEPENQIIDCCPPKHVLQGEEYKQIREDLCEIDSSLMDNEAIDGKHCVCHARQSSLQSELDHLQQKNAVLEHKQGQLVSEIEGLKLVVANLCHQVETLQQKCMYINDQMEKNELIVKDISYEKPALLGCDQEIYLLGGYDGKSSLQNADAINPCTFEMSPIAPMLVSRSYAAATVLMGQIYVLGGRNGELWYETAESYDKEKNEWALCSPMSIKRGSLAAATIGDRLYALGGGNSQVSFSEVECYDFHIGKWITSISMLNKRFGVAAAELDGALYAIGGYNDEKCLSSAERYDPRDDLWTSTAPLHKKRVYLSAVVLGGKIYAIGGYDGATYLNSVEVYESRMNQWLEMENGMHFKRAYGSAAVTGDKIYVFGGYTEGQYIQTVEQYHVDMGWSIVESAVVGTRCLHAGVVL